MRTKSLRRISRASNLVRLSIESLEDRRVLSAIVPFSVDPPPMAITPPPPASEAPPAAVTPSLPDQAAPPVPVTPPPAAVPPLAEHPFPAAENPPGQLPEVVADTAPEIPPGHGNSPEPWPGDRIPFDAPYDTPAGDVLEGVFNDVQGPPVESLPPQAAPARDIVTWATSDDEYGDETEQVDIAAGTAPFEFTAYLPPPSDSFDDPGDSLAEWSNGDEPGEESLADAWNDNGADFVGEPLADIWDDNSDQPFTDDDFEYFAAGSPFFAGETILIADEIGEQSDSAPETEVSLFESDEAVVETLASAVQPDGKPVPPDSPKDNGDKDPPPQVVDETGETDPEQEAARQAALLAMNPAHGSRGAETPDAHASSESEDASAGLSLPEDAVLEYYEMAGMAGPAGAPITAVPQEAGLAAEILPFDLAALDLALQNFMSQIDDIGAGLVETLKQDRLIPWLLAGGAGFAALEVVRRRRKQMQLAWAGTGWERMPSTWLPEFSDNYEE